MKLKEIEMDLPYKKNEEYICMIQKEQNLSDEDAIRRDYEVNWKEKRRTFQLSTRCMTAMIERIMLPIEDANCSKIVFECVDNCTVTKFKNCLNVCTIQVELDVETFFLLPDIEKKKKTIEIIMKGIKDISSQIDFNMSNISKACLQIVKEEYINEWIWKKEKGMKNSVAMVKIIHDVSDLQIIMVIMDDAGRIIKERKLINTLPDERVYDKLLGELKWISSTEIALISKDRKSIHH